MNSSHVLQTARQPEYVVIPIPLHPHDKDLPLSVVRIKLESGIFEACLPLQGQKTMAAAIATLELWKPVLVREEKKPICEDIAIRNLVVASNT